MAVSVQELKDKFKELFGGEGDIHAYFAPGRVNLIGEHTDYNGGHVFPCALTIGTYGIIRPRADRKLRFYSVNFSGLGIIETSLDELVPEEAADWTNYPKGVMWTFEKRGYHLPTGADILIYGDIPAGSGLSSSASLEVLTGLMLRDTFGFDISMVDLALIGQYSENNFNGMNCGIMDQFASAMGKKDCAIFLDTATLEYEYAPIKLPDAKIVITNSKVKHSLVSSAYNDRRRECETALKELQAVVDIKTLGDLTEEQFEAHKDAIQDPVCRKRAKHAVYENQRTIRAVDALKANDIETFGRLMNETHISLRDDFEVSCAETDLLAELAWQVPGVLGSRITGGGFGGCTVSIVKNESVDLFIQSLDRPYEEKTGHKAEFYVVDVGDGAHALD
ncbi:galactokinase [Lachnoclostridium sp. An196]|uniref:galactokinase n=1 Tax=Lachnoclostridium sp. An196 TaxID=1965583 RepID=UPI000B369160|nr:galactokinase [Lachnoclostridium sp. An196]OUP19039.1 galactokinase [Lachnoclostridium sp. An196]HIS07899.1 galactokinase [Candidatus Choladocola avistercoris]